MANDDQTKIKPLPVRKHSKRARPGNTNAQTHGLTVLKRAVNGLGNRLIDKRTATGRALAEWRKELVDDLGGKDAISAQQSAVIEIAVKSKLLLDSIDVWLLTQESLVNKRKRALLPAVIQRQALADGLVRYLQALA
jgi:hypothetical protein